MAAAADDRGSYAAVCRKRDRGCSSLSRLPSKLCAPEFGHWEASQRLTGTTAASSAQPQKW